MNLSISNLSNSKIVMYSTGFLSGLTAGYLVCKCLRLKASKINKEEQKDTSNSNQSVEVNL